MPSNPKASIVFTCSIDSNPVIKTVLDRYIIDDAAPPHNSDDDKLPDVEGGEGDDDVDLDEDQHQDTSMADDPDGDGENNESDGPNPDEPDAGSAAPAGEEDEANPAPKKKQKKYSTGLAPPSSDDSSEGSYDGSCYNEDDFVDDVDLRETVSSELVTEETSNLGLENENGQFYVASLTPNSPKKRGRKPKAATEKATGTNEITEQHAAALAKFETERTELKKLLNSAEPTTIEVKLPDDFTGPEHKIDDPTHGALTVPVSSSNAVGSTFNFTFTKLPSNLTVSQKQKIYEYSNTFEEYADAKIKYSGSVLKVKLKKRDVLMEKWTIFGGKEECGKVVKLWKERVKRKEKSDEKKEQKGEEEVGVPEV
ncbi:hypothetical protein TL16_g10825 [Triparma laevis f. inornata]|uniref:Uncharacterized protein n=1 Tax=Triparma laevis f. inornata TaxID=1714386 RepID=A0A9W7BIK8_9STRA|nr:hypothetical protein TL16_g10825 [Triparma laevis f. inornata]